MLTPHRTTPGPRPIPRLRSVVVGIGALTLGAGGLSSAAGLPPLTAASGAERLAAPAAWSEGSAHDGWRVIFNGGGAVTGATGQVTLAPATAAAASVTHAALVVSQSTRCDSDITVSVKTLGQLRKGSTPNPWEVGWVLTRFVDKDHFYAVALKPNGWELSKQDPAYRGSQRFLATGTKPSYPVGSTNRVRIKTSGRTLTVIVNGVTLTQFTDAQRPYLCGATGLYAEDARVSYAGFEGISGVSTAPAAAPTTPAPSPSPSASQSTSPIAPVPATTRIWSPTVPANGLVTNEWAYWNPTLPKARISPDWEMNSGSLFARSGAWWTGVPDNRAPDATSSTGTNSAIFRLTTRRKDFLDATTAVTLRVNSLTHTSTTPATDWDGVHILLRYRNEAQLYYASVARRDGHLVIKKKCPGGPSNGGTYYTLGEIGGFPITPGAWVPVAAGARTNADKSVTLTLARGGRTVLTVVDKAVGCAAIVGAGSTGIRADNADVDASGFAVSTP